MKINTPFLILCGVLVAVIVYINFLGTVSPTLLPQPLSMFPKQIGGFSMVEAQTFSEAVQENAGMDDYIMWQYRDQEGYTLSLYIGYYQDQTEGSIIHSPKHCMPGSGWEPFQMGAVPFGSHTVNRMLLQKGAEKQLAYYWFHGRGRIVASEYLDRAYMVIDSVFRQRSDGSLVRIIGYGSDIDIAERKQREFMDDLLPVLDGFLPK
ncbi:MAG: EpsI family protein [Desulfobulbaceae bacterium]|nr:EpsI family protein [Desulfobulbaceae bacterium]